MTELPVVRTRAEINQYATEQVRVIGRYTQIDVRQRPTSEAAYQGHVALVLEDGAKVLLYPVWHREAKRPSGEIARFEDQQVAVVGTIFPRAPSSRDHAANLLLPCLTNITAIEMAVPEMVW
jgi:hypothetical protein